MGDEYGTDGDDRVGRIVDERYKIIDAMASGSMGAVYKAERVPVGKLVAIKFLHASYANDNEFLARFERETRVMSKLAHPNCVSVLDFGVWEGAPYLVMEYVSGTTLRQMIDQGPLPPKRALHLVRQIAAGLAHAHAQGVVHRDVKPANIMISEEIGTGDHARILDFGLARLRGAVGRDATQSNVVVGTPNYMAPEQTVGGGLIDARTDIYAVGVVLFEMICGERPFQAEDTLALLGMHRAAPIPKLADRAKGSVVVPAGLQEVVEKAMAKAPSDRYQSAIELAEAIDEISAGRATGEVEIVSSRIGAKTAAGLAPTMLDVSDASLDPAVSGNFGKRKRGSFLGSLLFVAILVGGAGAAMWWIKLRNAKSDPPIAASGSGSEIGSDQHTGSGDWSTIKPIAADKGSAGSAAIAADKGSAGSAGSAAATATGSDTGSAAAGSAAALGSASTTEPVGSNAGSGSNVADLPGPGSAAAGSAAGSGNPGELEMDPTTADDPAPPSTKPSTADDKEDDNAPSTAEEVEKHEQQHEQAHATAAPTLATTINEAVQLIKEGKHELAISSLRALAKKNGNSAYIPFLLGNLYYDKRWWSVAMDHYATAIKKNSAYKSNPTINRNVIRMLASNKTSRKAQGFLKYTVGKSSLPYVRYAARNDGNSQVKRLAGWLSKNI